jgi:hypothetical protein
MFPDTLSLMLFPLLLDFSNASYHLPLYILKNFSIPPYSHMLLCVVDLLPPCSAISHWLVSEFMFIPPVLSSKPDFFHAAYSSTLKKEAGSSSK